MTEQIDNLISEQENMENYVEKVLKDFKAKTGEDAIELVGKADPLDFIADVYACEHMCSNCCEGEGCNCNCGEYHIEVNNEIK